MINCPILVHVFMQFPFLVAARNLLLIASAATEISAETTGVGLEFQVSDGLSTDSQIRMDTGMWRCISVVCDFLFRTSLP